MNQLYLGGCSSGIKVKGAAPTSQICAHACPAVITRHKQKIQYKIPQHSKESQKLQPCRPNVVCCVSAAALIDPADVIPDPHEDDDEVHNKVDPSTQHVLIAGAGPVGIVAAGYLARRGYNVEVYDQRPNPELGQNAHDAYPVVLSARALLALEELGMQTSVNGPNAVAHKGDYDMVTGAFHPAYPSSQFKRTAVADRAALVLELTREVRRLYPSKVRFHYGAQVTDVNLDRKAATIEVTESLAGSSMAVQQDAASAGRSMLVSCTRQPSGSSSNSSNVLPELAATTPSAAAAAASSNGRPGAVPHVVSERRVPYSLLVGADGAGSRVRECMRRAKVRDFAVQKPLRETAAFKVVTDLPQHVQPEPIPGLSAHGRGEYLYRYEAPGAPRLLLWVPQAGTVSGTLSEVASWDDPAALDAHLSSAYGDRLPAEWRQRIVAQATSHLNPAASSTTTTSSVAPQPGPPTVQCSQFHGPRVVLVGDAAHAMTDDLGQSLSCGIEGVRMLNAVLKLTGDSLDRAPTVFSEARCEDVHCVQQMELMQRSLRPGAPYGDPMFALAGWISRQVWQCALAMMALCHKWLPNWFPANWVSDQLVDARHGYEEVLKVITRFAAAPVLAVILVAGGAAWVASALR